MIPDKVTTLGEDRYDGSVFENCYSLKNITLPDSLVTIYPYCFKNCHSLESIIITDSVTSLGVYIFENCYNLKNVTLSNS